MAGMLFVYTRTSIKAAKLNAQRHREADGGIMNWGNEHLRRRGYREKIDDKAVLKEAFLGSPEEAAANARSAEEARLLVEAKEELERLKKSKQNDDEK
ncbi:hypothetical protein BDY21DRAFT_332591 [Lineolata rhizophorae]|uniref:Uncharacterized protein n=1 Tax=Lineolata rhizophorae TaxID=578093 RepID=A0A6A6PCH2_9PEZI|nr:hypothetical protein BDY21DRAFT_332591 [Lineolata rhizophorae]